MNNPLTVKEAAEILGISPIVAANLLRDKKLPGFKQKTPVGDQWFIEREDVAIYGAVLAMLNLLQRKTKEQPVEEGVPLELRL